MSPAKRTTQLYPLHHKPFHPTTVPDVTRTHAAMHPLPVAQATAASLHALLPRKHPTTIDEKLVVDAIKALHNWAIPDNRPVPTRLRLRRSVPLRIRIRSSPSSQSRLISKRRQRRVLQPRRYRQSAEHLGAHEPVPRIPRRRPSSAGDTVRKCIPQTPSSSNAGSQVVNSSDQSTEPPEGWPKLSDLPSPIHELHPTDPGSENRASVENSLAEAQIPAEDDIENFVSTPSLMTPQARVTSSDTLPNRTDSSPPTELCATRQHATLASLNKDTKIEAGKPNDNPNTPSQGSTRGADSPAKSSDANEEEISHPNAQVLSRSKKRVSKRKSSVPKRRRPASSDKSTGPPSVIDSEKDRVEQISAFEDSPPSNFDDSPLRQPQSAMSMDCNSTTESPTISAANKNKEQDMDGDSVVGQEPANSPGSVVIGSSSYDGRSLDMGYSKTDRTCNDIPSRPESIAWNDSNDEPIEDPSYHDQEDVPVDFVQETGNVLQRQIPCASKSSRQYESIKDTPGKMADPSHEQIKSALSVECFKRDSEAKEQKNSTRNSAPPSPGKPLCPNENKPSLPTTVDQSIRAHDRRNANHFVASEISPVSQQGHPSGDKTCPQRKRQRDNSDSSTEASFDEMVVCIASFSKEIESELAHELVMRLGGEVVSDFDNAVPQCVVAHTDPETEEIITQDVVVLLALASRVPVVGVSWLTHCFKSGCWVDFSNFEIPCSKLKSSTGVFRGIAATFEDAFSRKNAKRKCLEYRKGIEKLIALAEGVIVDKSRIAEVAQKDRSLKLVVQVAYDFENDSLTKGPQQLPGAMIPTYVVGKTWIFACLLSGQCPPP